MRCEGGRTGGPQAAEEPRGMDAREVRALARPDGSIVEVCSLAGNIRAFPNHLHDHYVVGALYASRRALTISARELHVLEPGDVFLVNPGDPHACDPLDDEPFAYRCANVPVAAMAALAGPDGGPADVPERARAAGDAPTAEVGAVAGPSGPRRARAAVRRSRAAGSRAVRAGGRVLQAGSTRGCTGARRARRFAARPSRRR